MNPADFSLDDFIADNLDVDMILSSIPNLLSFVNFQDDEIEF